MSVLERCPSYRESNKGSKERQGPTLGVRFMEVSVLQRCPLREGRLYFTDMSHVAAMYQEHHDIQGKDDKLCKWTDADALEAYEQNLFKIGSDNTVADMLECWQNPVFPAPARVRSKTD